MEGLHNLCRTCLRELNNAFYSLDHVEEFEDITLTIKLSSCIPEMNLAGSSASICFSCTATLRLAYEFRKMCLATEERFKNECQNQTCDNKITIIEQPIVKTETNEFESVTIKVEETDLDEDEDDWLRANGYFNTNSDIDDVFEETDSAESDPYDCCIIQNTVESDAENIIKKSCENIKFLKERNITPENLQCQVTIEKLPENNYSCDETEDTTATNVEINESNTSNQRGNKLLNQPNYWDRFEYDSLQICKVCDKQLCSRIELLKHIKQHKDVLIKKCSFCERVCFGRKSYMQHLVYHKNRLCLVCDLHFETKQQLIIHKKLHKRSDSFNKNHACLNNQAMEVTPSTSSASEEQFRRIVVSEDVFEKAIKSFSTEFFDENPPIIEKYCCSVNCNCEKKNSNNYDDSSDFSAELPSIFSLNLPFIGDPVRKSKEIAKRNIKKMAPARNIKKMAPARNRKRVLKKELYRNGIVSEHNYCKQQALTKKKKRKKKWCLKKTKKNSFRGSDVSNMNQNQNSNSQQLVNSETTNRINSNIVINENVIPPNMQFEYNNENVRKSKIEGDAPRKQLKVIQFPETNVNFVKKAADSLAETITDRSKEKNEIVYCKTIMQESSTESSGINSMSLADLLKDTVNINSKVQQGLNSEAVTLKDLLNNLNDPPTSLHVVTPHDGTVTNYMFSNTTDLTNQIQILLKGKKTRPNILKEVLNKTLNDCLSTQSQSTTNALVPDNTPQPTQLQPAPIHDKLQSNQNQSLVPIGLKNNRQNIAVDTVECEKNKLMDSRTNSNNELFNNILTNHSKGMKIVIPSNMTIIPVLADPTLLHSLTSRKSNFFNNCVPDDKINRLTESQGCSFNSQLESTPSPSGYLNETTLVTSPLIETSTSNNSSINPENNFPCENYHASNFTINQPNTIETNFNKSQFYASVGNINRIQSSDLSSKPSVIDITSSGRNSGGTDEPIANDSFNPVMAIPELHYYQKESTLFPSTLKYTDNNKRYWSNTDKSTSCLNNDSEMTNSKPINHRKESTSFPSVPLTAFNKRSRDNAHKLIASPSDTSTITNEEPVKQQTQSTSFPINLNYANNEKISLNINKPTNDPVLTNAAPKIQQNESTSFPSLLNVAGNKRNMDNTTNRRVSAMANKRPPIQQKELTHFSKTLKYTYCNKNSERDTNKSTFCTNNVSENTNAEPRKDRNESASFPLNCIVSASNGSTITNKEPSKNERETVHLATTSKYADNNEKTVKVNNGSLLTNKRHKNQQTSLTVTAGDDVVYLLDSDSDDTVTECDHSNGDISENADNTVDLTTETDTFSVNFNYIRDQIEGNSQNNSQNQTYVSHGIRTKPFARQNRAVATQSSAEQFNEQEDYPQNFNLPQPEISPQNVECVDPISGGRNSENKKDATNAYNPQKKNAEIKTPSEKDSFWETNVDHSINVISLAKRDYDREIKKMFNLTFKPTKTQKCDTQNRNTDQNEANNSEALLYSYLNNSCVQEENKSLNNNKRSKSFVLDPQPSTSTNSSDYSEQRDLLNSSLVKPPVYGTSSRTTFDEEGNIEHEKNEIADNLFDMRLFDNEKVNKTYNDQFSFEASSTKRDENKSSKQELKKYAINENASTSKQQSISNQESYIDFSKATNLKEADKSKKTLLHTCGNFKLKISKFDNERLLKLGDLQEKCPVNKLETEKVKGSEDAMVNQKITNSNEPGQVLEAEISSEKKGKLVCRYCRKYFDHTFQRELHQCQISFTQSARKIVKNTTCEKCGNEFTNEILKNMHVCHINKSYSRNRCNGSVKWTCTVCSQKFSSSRLLCIHLNSAHDDLDSSLIMNASPPKTLNQCFFCKKTFKNGIYRFLHLLCHLSFRKHKCKKDKGVSQRQTQHKSKSGKVTKYKLSELAYFLQIGNVRLMKICKHMQKKVFLKLLNKVLNYLHLVRCRRCNKISGGWFNETLQSYFIKWRYLHDKPPNGKSTNSEKRNASPNSDRNYGLRKITTARRTEERSETVNFYRKQMNPRIKRLNTKKKNKQTLIRQQMLRVMSDLGLNAEEMNNFTSDALKRTSPSKCKKDNFFYSGKGENSNKVTPSTNEEHSRVILNHPPPKQVTCKYCLVKFKCKINLKMHKNTALHKHNVALLQKSENEIEEELSKSIDQPQTLKDIKRAIKYTMDKIRMIKKYHCEVCNDAFISRNQLELHKKTHEKCELRL